MSALKLRVIDNAAGAAPRTGAVRVAIATQDRRTLDAHFGSARHLAIYDVTAEGWALVETVAFGTVSDETGAHAQEGEDRIAAKLEALAGCHLLFCRAIGGPSAAKVVSAKVHPIKVPAPQPIDEVLARTRAMLAGAPPPWLRKVLAAAGVGPAKPAFADE